MPSGNYDFLFMLKIEQSKMFVAGFWRECRVQPGVFYKLNPEIFLLISNDDMHQILGETYMDDYDTTNVIVLR